MLAYFLRRLLGGAFTFLVAACVLYTAIVPFGEWVLSIEPGCMHCPNQPRLYARYGTYAIYKLDRPWPTNFLAWLYDPNGDEPQTFNLRGDPLGLPARTVQFTSPGLLRGDFGQSLRVRPGMPALAAYGIEPMPWMTFIVALLFGSMAVAYVQRRSREESYKAQRMWSL